MTTTIYRSLKSAIMEEIFDNSEILSVRGFEALNYVEGQYDPENTYNYTITIRHPEQTNATALFEQAIEIAKKKLKE